CVGPTFAFIKQLVFGIADALAAGNIPLAGRIAVKGLQVVFQEGVNAIADVIGGTLGDLIGELGTKAISGDLMGAWRGAVQAMSALWANFAKGVVSVFTSAAKAVTDVWAKTVSGIANGLLRASASGGVLGKIASTIVGVDVGALKAENDR